MPALRHIVTAVLLCLVVSPVAAAQRIISEINDGFYAYSMVINQATNKIYVSSEATNELIVIDGATNTVTNRVPVGRNPLRPTLNSAANKIYVPNAADNTITIVDGATLATTTVHVGTVPSAIGVNPVTNKIYVANADSNDVTVIDGQTLATTTLAADEGPLAVAVNTVTNKIYVGNQKFYTQSTVTVIDGVTNQTTTVRLPAVAYFYSGPNSLTVDEARNQIYALNSEWLFGIDGVSNQSRLVAPWTSGYVQNMVFNSTTNHMYGGDCGSVDDIDLAGQTQDQFYTLYCNTNISLDTAKNRVYAVDPSYLVFTALDLNTRATTYINQQIFGSQASGIATNSNTNTTYFALGNGVAVVAGATPMQFVPVPPCRVQDTRNSGGPIMGGSIDTVDVLASGCNIPASASAYSLNVTLVPAGNPVGYLTLWPTDQFQSTTSLMNSPDGRVKANASIVAAGTLGKVNAYVSSTTDVVIDIDGYFAPSGASTLAYYPMTPCRVIDTRGSDGDLGGPYLSGAQVRNFPVTESSCIPQGANAQAYSFNFTVTPHGGPMRYLTVWPQGQNMPLVSTLNNYTATTVANAAIVPAGAQGGISVYPSDNTDLIVDIDGYFAAPQSGGLSLNALTPCRVLDTRQDQGAFQGELRVDMFRCAIPGNAQAFVLNATAVPQAPLGYLTLWPDGQSQPQASTLNAPDGRITSNMAIVPNGGGYIDAYASGLTQLLLDISGYFAP